MATLLEKEAIKRIGRILRVFIYTGKDISIHIQPKLLPVPMSYYGQNIIN